jgi:hypothetical protein
MEYIQNAINVSNKENIYLIIINMWLASNIQSAIIGRKPKNTICFLFIHIITKRFSFL